MIIYLFATTPKTLRGSKDSGHTLYRRLCQYYYFVFLYQKSVFHTLKIRRFHNIMTVSCGFYKYRTVAYSLQHTCGKPLYV